MRSRVLSKSYFNGLQKFLTYALIFVGFAGLCGKIGENAFALEFSDDIERDFAIRTLGQLNVTNLRGDVTIEGWAQDRIRVRAQRVVVADAPENTAKLFSALGFRFQNFGKEIDLAVEYGKGLSLEERLKERKTQKTVMHIFIQAPAKLKLRVWTVNGRANVKNWNAPVELRTSAGRIDVEDLKGGGAVLLCATCDINASRVRGNLRAIGGNGKIFLDNVKGANVYAEGDEGSIQINQIDGEQLYVLKAGKLVGQNLRGRVEFNLKKVDVDLAEIRGFLSGRVFEGNILAKIREWYFSDKAFLETADGSISVVFPAAFSGEIDAWSEQGKVLIGFPIQETAKISKATQLKGGMRVTGVIGGGRNRASAELLRVFSEKGDVSIVKE